MSQEQEGIAQDAQGEDSHISLGDRLTERRKYLGLTIRGAAKRLGISYAYVDALEKGTKRNPSMNVLRKLSEVYGVPADELMGV